jgi:protein O-mannosyl-transferase
MKKYWVPLHIILIVLMTLIAYFELTRQSSLETEFVFDDVHFIVNNPAVKELSPSRAISFFTDPQTVATDTESFAGDIYRPLRTLSYAIDWQLYSGKPSGFHLTSLLIHILCAVLFYFLLLTWLGRFDLAFLGALLFAVHPAQTEAVSWIASRADLICAFWILGTLLIFTHVLKKNRRWSSPLYYLCWLTFILALLGKELAIVLPALLILIDLFLDKDKKLFPLDPKRLLPHIPFWIIALIYFIIRRTLIGQTAQMDYWGGSPAVNFMTMVPVMLKYIKLLFWPWPLVLDPGIPLVTGPGDPRFWLGLLCWVLVIAVVIFLARKDKRTLIGFGWFILFLLPVSNIVPIKTLFAERFFYLPSIGAIIFVILALRILLLKPSGGDVEFPFWNWKRGDTLVYLILFIICVSSLALTSSRNHAWRSEKILWIKTAESNPNVARPYGALGRVYLQENELPDAKDALKKAVKLSPDNYKYLTNLSITYEKLNQIDLARETFKKALTSNPDYYLTRISYARFELGQNNIQEAHNIFLALSADWPEKTEVHNGLGQTFFRLGQNDKALESFKKSIALDTDNPKYFYDFGIFYGLTGQTGKQIELFENTVKVGPKYVPAWIGLIRIHTRDGNYEKAIKTAIRAGTANPKNADITALKARALLKAGNQDEARDTADAALAIDPTNKTALEVIEILKK